jgi:TolB protein
VKVSLTVKTTNLLALTWIYLGLPLLCALIIVVSVIIGSSRQQAVISFVSSLGLGKNVLQLMDVEMRLIVRLGENIVYCCARWSPDGQEIIFDTFNGQGTNPLKRIYRMNADGRQTRPLMSFSERNAQTGAWSPDGRFVAYVTVRFEFVTEIALLDTQTGVSRQLTDNHTYAEGPVWSPDGQFIVFTSQQGRANWDICRVNPDGSEYQNLTESEGSDNLPAVSPDGRYIIFISNRSGKQLLYRMDADGNNLQPLTTAHTLEIAPSWSPDGGHILFVSEAIPGKVDISRINADGSDLRRLATISGSEPPPVWSPDGRQILFVSVDNSGNTNLHMMDADGEHLRKLSDDNNRETNLAWYPG